VVVDGYRQRCAGDMFGKLGHFVIRFRFAFLIFWLALAAACYLFAPTLEEVGKSDETSFLPDASESQETGALLAEAFPTDSSPGQATLVFSRPGGLTDADRAFIAGLPEAIAGPGAPEELRAAVLNVVTAESNPQLAPWLRSPDGVAEIAQVNLNVGGFERTGRAAVVGIRDLLVETLPSGLQGNVTGQAGIGADYLDAALRATDRTTVVTVVLVVLILLAIYRAPLAALAPLITIGVAWVVARGVLGWAAQAGWQVSSTLDTFMVVLVFGVGTDYSIFLISRVREELAHDEWAGATRRAVGRIGGVISASAATVVVGLSAMAVARFGMIRSVGPALALAIVVTLLAGLTLTPAYLGLFGRYLFWPFHRRIRAHDGRRGPWAGLARAITRRPGVFTAVLVVALAIPALAMPSLRSDFNLLEELPPTGDGRTGYLVVGEHFDEGQLSPVTVLVDAPGRDLSSPDSLALLRHTHDLLAALPGVASVTSLVSPGGDGVTPDGFRPSVQLAGIAEQLVPGGEDPLAALQRLLEGDTEAGIEGAASYIEGLGGAFPGLSEVAAYRSSLGDLDSFAGAVGLLRNALRVSTQLEFVAGQVGSAAGAEDPAAQLVLLQGYLAELAAAYPEVGGSDAYRDAGATLGALTDYGANPELVSRLVGSLRSLAAEFADRPDAYLISTLMSSSPQGLALQGLLAQPLSRLPGELSALAAEFEVRPDFFLPAGLSTDGQDEVAQLRGSYLSPESEVTQIRVILAQDPYDNAAIDLIPGLRRAVAAEAPAYGAEARILAGGQTAAYADIRQTIGEDFWRVAAITVAGILLVLILLLRALVAPLYLVATVLLSWMASLGLAAFLFQDLLGHSGVSYFLPLIVFVLLVALGSDYNIFLMSRVREESDRLGIHDGIQVASARTGTVITSAGIILAGTFAAMAIAPLRMLLQIGVTVALGVLIDTFVVRSMLVPAITALFGKWAWWPWHRQRLRPAAAGEAEASADGG
jgi:RND superfamily putative drug exporter